MCKFLWFAFLLGIELTIINRGQAQTYCEDKPKILFYRRGQAALVSESSNEVDNHVVVSNVNKEFLTCVSSRNVEWTYEGEGEPSKFQESSNVDIQKYEDGSMSYCVTSQITFYNKQSDSELSRHTGKYSCREIGNSTNGATVYVFASRKNSPVFLHSRKTLTLPLGQDNITLSVSSSLNDITGKNSSAGEGFVIPCVTTRPDVSAKLLKRGKNNAFVKYSGTNYTFNPTFGFHVSVSTTRPIDLTIFYGEYKCVTSSHNPSRPSTSNSGSDDAERASGTNPVEDFVLVTLAKAKSLHLYPPTNEVYTSGLLNFTCESEEPVIMKEVLPQTAQDVYSYLDEDDYARDRSDDFVETTERTEQKTHIANYMELSPAPGRTGEIQCLSEKDGRVLHVWKYKIIRKRADKLSGIKFNKRESSFTCKGKLGGPGKLSFVNCRTPSECRVNQVCLLKSENCRGYSNSTKAFCERKSHFCGKIFHKGGSGLIRCIAEGLDEIRGFTDESSDQSVRLGFGKVKASETALLRLEGNVQQPLQNKKQNESNDVKKIYEGDRVNATLRLGYYYFLYPIQWAVKFSNGSTQQINPDSQFLKVEKLTRTVHATLTLPYTYATHVATGHDTGTTKNITQEQKQNPQVSEITTLHALIPLRSSVDPSWKTISLPITVYGKVGMQQLPTDTDSDEVEQQQTEKFQVASSHADDNVDKIDTQVNNGTEAVDTEIDDDDEEDEEDQDTQPAQSIIDSDTHAIIDRLSSNKDIKIVNGTSQDQAIKSGDEMKATAMTSMQKIEPNKVTVGETSEAQVNISKSEKILSSSLMATNVYMSDSNGASGLLGEDKALEGVQENTFYARSDIFDNSKDQEIHSDGTGLVGEDTTDDTNSNPETTTLQYTN